MTKDALQWCVDKKLKVVGLDYAHVRDYPGALQGISPPPLTGKQRADSVEDIQS